ELTVRRHAIFDPPSRDIAGLHPRLVDQCRPLRHAVDGIKLRRELWQAVLRFAKDLAIHPLAVLPHDRVLAVGIERTALIERRDDLAHPRAKALLPRIGV